MERSKCTIYLTELSNYWLHKFRLTVCNNLHLFYLKKKALTKMTEPLGGGAGAIIQFQIPLLQLKLYNLLAIAEFFQ